MGEAGNLKRPVQVMMDLVRKLLSHIQEASII